MRTAEETRVKPPEPSTAGLRPTAGNALANPPKSPEQVRCSGCGHPMATDQRYCLDCGQRRGGPRVEFDEYLGPRAEAEQPGLPAGGPPPPPVTPAYSMGGQDPDPRPVREVTPLMAAAGLMAFALILLFGVLLGKQGGGDSGTQTPIVAATGLPSSTTPGSTSTTDVNVAFEADWPAGKEGFTIELATLSKEGTDTTMVEATKTDLAAQGASEVGVLDSDEFGTLPAGNYVFYSGEYASKAEAESALTSLSASFPDAQVIEVAAEASTPVKAKGGNGGAAEEEGETSIVQEDGESESTAPVQASEEALEEIDNASAEEYQELQKKLPPTIETPGEAPPKDNKAPGGGSGGAVEIG